MKTTTKIEVKWPEEGEGDVVHAIFHAEDGSTETIDVSDIVGAFDSNSEIKTAIRERMTDLGGAWNLDQSRWIIEQD